MKQDENFMEKMKKMNFWQKMMILLKQDEKYLKIIG